LKLNDNVDKLKLFTMSDQSSISASLKQFLTEEQIEIERQRRQADWERVRSSTDPIEAPVEVFDTRSLYEKLKAQHEEKKKEYEDMWAAKNSIRGLDEDETDFLTRLDHARAEKQRELKRMEQEEIEELKKKLKKNSKLLQQIHVQQQLNNMLHHQLSINKNNYSVELSNEKVQQMNH